MRRVFVTSFAGMKVEFAMDDIPGFLHDFVVAVVVRLARIKKPKSRSSKQYVLQEVISEVVDAVREVTPAEGLDSVLKYLVQMQREAPTVVIIAHEEVAARRAQADVLRTSERALSKAIDSEDCARMRSALARVRKCEAAFDRWLASARRDAEMKYRLAYHFAEKLSS